MIGGFDDFYRTSVAFDARTAGRVAGGSNATLIASGCLDVSTCGGVSVSGPANGALNPPSHIVIFVPGPRSTVTSVPLMTGVGMLWTVGSKSALQNGPPVFSMRIS